MSGDDAGRYNLPSHFPGSSSVGGPFESASGLTSFFGFPGHDDGLTAGWPLTFPSPETGHNANLATPGFLSSVADNLLPNSHALFDELNDLLPSSSVQHSSMESHGTLDESWRIITRDARYISRCLGQFSQATTICYNFRTKYAICYDSMYFKGYCSQPYLSV